jgi:hypothetical protein
MVTVLTEASAAPQWLHSAALVPVIELAYTDRSSSAAATSKQSLHRTPLSRLSYRFGARGIEIDHSP